MPSVKNEGTGRKEETIAKGQGRDQGPGRNEKAKAQVFRFSGPIHIRVTVWRNRCR